MEFTKKILVAGTGKSGICATELLLSKGAQVVLFDENKKGNVDASKVMENFSNSKDVELVLGSIDNVDLDNIQYMVLSPGISFESPFTDGFREKNIPIYSEIELAYQLSEGTIAAITGTNGKTTTTSLVGEIMKAHSANTYVVGNIGIPYTKIANKTDNDSIIVAEISSFQLETIIDFKPKVSAILNLTPDHLDRHHTMENYGATKFKIGMNQTKEDVMVLNYDDAFTKDMAEKSEATVVFFSRLHTLDKGVFLKNGVITLVDEDKEIGFFKPEELKILGGHNVENVMAAVAIAYYMGVNVDTIKTVTKNFAGVEHRIEYVGTVDGTMYYNDSKGTNPDAAIKAVEAMIRPTLLIGGGYDKKVPFDDWVKTFEGKVKLLVLLGQTAKDIAACCDKYGYKNYVFADSLEEAIDICKEKATSDDAVLLSPACASWGMFDNYEQRGDMFRDYVKQLKG